MRKRARTFACRAAQTLEQEAYEKALQEKKYPKFWPGDVVEVKLVRITF